MGATTLGDAADDREIILNSENDKEYLDLCGIMALQDEITRGSALRDLKSKLGSINAGVRKGPKMVEYGSTRKAKRERKLCKKHIKCYSHSFQKPTPYAEDICMIDHLFFANPNRRKRDKSKRTIKRRKEKKCKEICPLGVLELAVPSKRQCLETWREYNHVLSAHAITKLKEIIFDQKPIIEVSAAVECFNLHKSKCKKIVLKRKKEKMRRMLLAKDKKRIPNRFSRICANLAREVLSYLKTPREIKLDSDCQRLAAVIYKDMRQMLKKIDAKHLMNRHFLKDAAKKGAVWVGSILEQYEDMVVYDEIRDLEETEGPILDLLDEILNAVLDFCEPSYKVQNSESALNYFSGDISLASFRKGSHGTDGGSYLDDFRRSSDLTHNRGLEEAGGKYKLGIKLAKDYEDLDSDVRRDIIETADEVTRSITDMAEAAVTKSLTDLEEARRNQLEDDGIVLAKPRSAESSESDVEEAEKDQEQSLNKAYEKERDQRSENSEISKPADDMIKGTGEKSVNNEDVETIGQEIKTTLKIVEKDQVKGSDKLTDQETRVNIMQRDAPDIDQGEDNDVNNTIEKKPEGDPESTTQSYKVNKGTDRQSARRNSNVTFQNHKELKIGPMNDDLLSDADEIWPKDIPFPVMKPSVSVTQSITTLGNITESEETIKDAGELTEQLSELIKTTNDFEGKPEKKSEDSIQPSELDQNKEFSLPDELPQIEELKVPREFITHKGNTLFRDERSVSKVSHFFTKPAELIEYRTKTKDLDDLTRPPELLEFKTKLEDYDNFTKPAEFIKFKTTPRELHNFTKPAKLVEYKNKLNEIDKNPKTKPYKPMEIQQFLMEMERDMKNVETKRQKFQKTVPLKSPSKPATKALTPTKKDTRTIFDYRVRPETAPAWLLKRVSSCRAVNNEYDKNLKTCVHNKDQIKNVLRESDNLVKSLELWNRWIESTCEKIITLKQNTDAAKYVNGRCSGTRCIIRQWRHLEDGINQATEQWRHCKASTHNKLRRSQKLLFSKY